MDDMDAMGFLLDKIKATKNNSDFFDSMKRVQCKHQISFLRSNYLPKGELAAPEDPGSVFDEDDCPKGEAGLGEPLPPCDPPKGEDEAPAPIPPVFGFDPVGACVPELLLSPGL